MKGLFSVISALAKSLNVGARWNIVKKAGKNPFSHVTAQTAMNSLKFQGVMAAITLAGPGTPDEKATALAWNVGTAFMTLGMSSAWRQFGWGVASSLVPHFGTLSRGIVAGYRNSLESRTSAAIPFSHSNIAQDQAFATLQYARARMSDAYSNLGSEAGFFAARFMTR